MESEDTGTIRVEVAYATPNKQKIIALRVLEGSTALEVARSSGINGFFEGVDVESAPMGIFGNALGARGMPPAAEYKMREGDRLELYRPLIADPKEVRRKRAAELAAKKKATQG